MNISFKKSSWRAQMVIAKIVIFSLVIYFTESAIHLPLIFGLAFIYSFGALWYLPNWLENRKINRILPTSVYFLVGTVLICLGCISSTIYAGVLSNYSTLRHIGEIMPLVLGAFVGGNYCCDAILGREFAGEFFRLRYRGALLGVVTILLCLTLTIVFYNSHAKFPYYSIAIVAFSPLSAILFLDLIDKHKGLSDPPFWIFISGALLIVITGVASKFLLDSLNLPAIPGLINQDQAVSMVKNLVPAYCSAIGAGLILRAFQKNLPPLSLEHWAKNYLSSWLFHSVEGNKILFMHVTSSNTSDIVGIEVSETVLKALSSSAYERSLYGREASKWLSEKLKDPKIEGPSLKMPTAKKLAKGIWK
jgi:hypothetical protein